MPTVLIDTSSTSSTLVTAPGINKFIQVVGLDITSNGVVTTSLTDTVSTVWKTYATTIAGGGIVLPISDDRDINCGPNRPLNLTLSASITVTGTLTYTIRG